MSSFFRFTLLGTLILFSVCIKLAPAQFSAPFSLPSCTLFSHNSSWILEKAIDDNTRNLTLFKLSFLTNQSISFTFTTTYNTSDIEDDAPGVVFIIIVRSGPPQLETGFPCMREQYTFSHEPILSRRAVCNPLPHEQIQAPTSCFLEPADPYDSDDTSFKDVVLLTYDAFTTSLRLQANLSRRLKKIFSKNEYLHPDAVDSTVGNENLALFVGFITSVEASINVTNSTDVTIGESASPPISGSSLHVNSAPPPVHDNAKSNHKKVIVWVIVGVSVMGLLMGLLILVLFITKRRRRLFLHSSRPAGGLPSVTSRAPFSHLDFATPMKKALPLSPPHTSAFQISGTASWLQQPNPR